MNVNLDSFRAMTQGKYNLGSVVVSTDGATMEQQLHKVDNHRHFSSRNVAPLPEENVKTRQVLSSLMKARLQQIAGTDLANNAELRAEVAKLDSILLGDNLREKLDRKGALAEAFKAFDAVETRLLKTRVVTDRLRVANAARIEVEEKELDEPKEKVEKAGGDVQAQKPAKIIKKSIKFYNGRSPDPTVLYEVDMRSDDSKEVADDKEQGFTWKLSKAEAKLAAQRSQESVEKKLEKIWGENPELAPKGSASDKAVDTARKLHSADRAVIDILVKKRSPEELERVFLANPAAAHAVQKEVFGALQYLAKVQADHGREQEAVPADQRQPMPAKTVSIKMFVDNAKINTRTMDLTLKSDGQLELSLRGHRFELGYTVQEFKDLIRASSTVKPRGGTYFSAFDHDNHTRAHVDCADYFCAWYGNEKVVKKGPDNVERVKMFPPENTHQIETKISEILDELREVNNQSPHLWGGSPHYGNEMPQLEPLRHARFGNRTWAHIRSYCNQQIARGGFHAVMGRALAKIQGVPLESGQHCGIGETKFEEAALFLNKVRVLALNVNWIFSQFENRPGETDKDAINRICTLVSDTCQLQLHPNEGSTMHPKSGLMDTIRALIQSTVKGFDMAKKNNDLQAYFTALTEGACFQGCTTCVVEYCDRKFGTGVSTPASDYPQAVRENVEQRLQRKIVELKTRQAELESQIKDLDANGGASRQELKDRLAALQSEKSKIDEDLVFWEARELGTGAVYMDDNGEVILDMLSEKEKTKGQKVKNAPSQLFEWDKEPSFSGELLPNLMRDIYREIRFGGIKIDGQPIGVPPFFLPKVDTMVDLIVDRFKLIAETAKDKGEPVKGQWLDQEIGKLRRERDNIVAAINLLDPSQNDKSAIGLLALLDKHIQAAGILDARTMEFENSETFKARVAGIEAKNAEIKASAEYLKLMEQTTAKIEEVEKSEEYRKLATELEEQLKTVEASDAYRKIAQDLEKAKRELGEGESTYKQLLDQEKELLDEKARVDKWLAEGRAAYQRRDQDKMAELRNLPENALYPAWQNPKSEKSLKLADVQGQIAALKPRVTGVWNLEEQLANLKKPFQDAAAAKQSQLKQMALSELRKRNDQLFQPVTDLKKEHARIREEFLAQYKAKLAEVEEPLASFRKALPVYDEEHCATDGERKIGKRLTRLSNGIAEALRNSRTAKVNSGRALAANLKSDANFIKPAVIKAELEKWLKNVEGRIQEMQGRRDKVSSFELNLALVMMDLDSYGNQQNDFIYLSVDDFQPGHEDKLADFKRKIKDELIGSGYVYHKSNVDEPPSYVVGEETFMPNDRTKGVAGDGFVQSQWSATLHGSEFVRGLSKNGEDVLRSNEGVEINSPVFTRDSHRKNPDGDDYEYQEGDMKFEILVG